ncbi:MAG: uroporphyrinogen-III C-methyltransferase [Terriglobales bacterium]
MNLQPDARVAPGRGRPGYTEPEQGFANGADLCVPSAVIEALEKSEYTFAITAAEQGCEHVLAGVLDVALVPADELPFPLSHGLDVAALMSAGEDGQLAGEGTRATQSQFAGGGARTTHAQFTGGGAIREYIAAVTRRRRPELRVLLYRFDRRRDYGKVWLVGFGPGDPELMTLKADRVLQSADIIFYDSLIDAGVLARYPGERVFVGKRKGNHAQRQDKINELLYRAALDGKTVVRLKGGDPFIFGRGGEESEYLRRRMIAVEVVPGVTAATGAAAGFNLPLTKRNVSRSLTFTTGHGADNSPVGAGETRVVYMGATRLETLRRELLVSGLDANTPVALVQNASLPTQRCVTTTVANLPGHELAAPVMVIVGEVARDAHVPRTILHTGMDASGFHFAERLIHLPMGALTAGAPELSCVDEVVFTSAEAVEEFVSVYGGLPADILFHLCSEEARDTFVRHAGAIALNH